MNTNWHRLDAREVDYCLTLVTILEQVSWAKLLADKLADFSDRIKRYRKHQNSLNGNDLLTDWKEIENLRPYLFEARVAAELIGLGLDAEYEFSALGKSTVDFLVRSGTEEWLIECVSVLDSKVLTSLSDYETIDGQQFRSLTLRSDTKNSSESPAGELIRLRGRILEKISKHKRTEDIYECHKFPLPTFRKHAILCDGRGFGGGEGPDSLDSLQLMYGPKRLLKAGLSHEISFFGEEPVYGLFDEDSQDEQARMLQERIHLLVMVNEKEFGHRQLMTQAQIFSNPFLAPAGTFPLLLDDERTKESS